MARALALGLILVIGGASAWAQQRSFRHEIDLSDSFTFSQGSQDIRVEGHEADGEMGSAVVFADIDGDGRLDVVQSERNSNEVHVFFGRQVLDPNDVNSSDPNTAYVVTQNIGVFADRPDVRIILNPATNDTSAEFGFSLAAGNVNGDTDPNTGLPLQDILIGAPFDDAPNNDSGRVFVVRGRPAGSWPALLDVEVDASTSQITAANNSDDYLLGFSVAAGDFTGDGIDDIAASSRHAAMPLFSANITTWGNGAVHLIQGSGGLSDVDVSTDGSVRHITGRNDSDFLGEYLDFCNINGGASESLLMGAIGVDNGAAFDAGAMFVYLGPTLAGLGGGAGSASNVSGADSRILGADSEDSLGFSIACADINGDGRDDPTVGAFFASGAGDQVSGGGEVFVFYGAPTIPSAAFPAVIDLADPNSSFGVRVLPSTAGDQMGFSLAYGNVDCDPNSPMDLIVGSRRYDPQDPNTGAVSVNAGAAYVIRGAPRAAGTQLNMGLGTYDSSNPAQRPGNYPVARNDGADFNPMTPSPPSCDPLDPDDPANPCAVMAVMLGTTAHGWAGYSASAGDFNGDGCDEVALGAIGDLTRISGFRGRVYVSAVADNDADLVSDLSDTDDDNDCLADDDESDAGIGSSIVTDPLVADTDMDGIQDGTELGVTAGQFRKTIIFTGADCSTMDPAFPQCCLDADAGGTATDPNNNDTDGDNLLDGAEDLDADGAILGDTSGDGVADPNEIFAETNPNDPDTDGDGIDDDLETLGGCPSPLDADSDDDGLPDGCIGACGNPQNGESLNGDAVVDMGETDFCLADSDLDGLQDGTELGVSALVPGPNTQDDSGAAEDGTDPALFQPDLDPAGTTDPLDTDTDDDCLPDGCMAALGVCPPSDPNAAVLQGEDVNLNGRQDGAVLIGGAGTGGSPAAGAETDPDDDDSDNDLLFDGLEWGAGNAACAAMAPATDPNGRIDTDPASVTDPRDSDTDDGSVEDGTEDQSTGGALDGSHDFDPVTFACDPNGNFLLDTNNETDPLLATDDRGASFSRVPSPAFADPNNTLLITYLQNDSVVVLLLDTDENDSPTAIDTVSMNPAILVDPSDATLVRGLGCIPDDPNTVFNRDTEAIVLTEIDPNTGAPAVNSAVFRGIVPLSTAAGGAGTLNLCTEDDRVRFAYGDPDDLCDQRVIVGDVTLGQIRSVDPNDGATRTSPVIGVDAVFEQDLACGSVTATNFTVTGTMGPAAADPNGPVTCVTDPNQPGRGNRVATLNFPGGLPDDLYAAALACDPATGITDRNGFPADCESTCVAPPGNPAYCAGALSGDGTAGGTFAFGFTVDNDSSPSVASVDPANASVVDPNRPGLTTVEATFSEAMDAATLDPNSMSVTGTMMVLTPVLDPNTGNFPYDPAGKRVRFVSSGGTLADDRYTVVLQDTILDLAGNALDGDDNGTAGTDFGSTFVIDYDQVPLATPVTPLDGAVTVDPNASIVLSFDQAMEESTVEDPNNWTVTGTMMGATATAITYDPVLKRVTFDPSGSLADDLYTITFDGATDHAGNALDGDGNGVAGGAYVATFIVDADSTPTAAADQPAASSTISVAPTAVTVLFSEAMDANSIDVSSFVITTTTFTVGCTYGFDPNTKIGTCTVTSPPALPDDSYTVTLVGDPNGVLDFAGNPIDGDLDPNTPGGNLVYGFILDGDNTPSVTVIDPNDTEVIDPNRPGLAAVAATFSEIMDAATIDPNTFTVEGTMGALTPVLDPNTGGIPFVDGTRTATFTSSAGVMADDLYTVTITDSVLDLAANPLDGDDDPNTLGVDFGSTFVVDYDQVPGVVPITPGAGATTADPNQVITLEFDQSMAQGSVEDPNNWTVAGTMMTVTPGSISYNPVSKRVTFTPSAPLPDDLYSITFDGALDHAGNAMDGDNNGAAGGAYTATFIVDADVTPTAAANVPAASSVVMSSVSTIDVLFSEAIDSSTVDPSTFTVAGLLSGPVTCEFGSVPYDPVTKISTCTVVSPTPLPDDDYTVTLASDPNGNGILDLAGNPLDDDDLIITPPANTVYTFEVDLAPVVTEMSPAPDADVSSGPLTAISLTFDQAMNIARLDPNHVTISGTSGERTCDSLVSSTDPNTGQTRTTCTIAAGFVDDLYTVALDGTTGSPVNDSDAAGKALDGECLGGLDAGRCEAAEIDPNTGATSGNGTAGGDYAATFLVDIAAPSVVDVDPNDGSLSPADVALVTVTFSEAMDGSRFDPNTLQVVDVSDPNNEVIVAGVVAYDPNALAATFDPNTDIGNGSYEVRVQSSDPNTGVADQAGNLLTGGDFTSTFGVQSTATVRIQTVDPEVNEVLTATALGGDDLDANFTNNLEASSVSGMTYFMLNSTSTLGDPNTYEPCNASRRGGGNKDKIDCDGVSTSLADDRYTVYIKSDLSDPNVRIHARFDPNNYVDAENPCTVSCSGVISGDGFKGGDFIYSFFIDADAVPVVTGTLPSAAATITDPNNAAEITVTFDQRMDPNTFVPGTTVTLVGANVGAISVTVTFDPSTATATLTPATVPLPDDDYTLTLFSNPAGDAVRDHSIVDPNTQPLGNALDGDGGGTAGGDFTLDFTVDADQVPQITEMAPAPESTSGVAITSVDVTFDQVMDLATLDPNTFTVSGSVIGAVTADSISFDPNGLAAMFNRAAGFIDETYTVTLDSDGAGANVADLEGNLLDGECTGGADPNTCEAAEIDPNIPVTSGDGSTGGTYRAVFIQDADPFPNVTTVTPADSSTGASAVTSVVFTFDQLLDGATAQDPNNLTITGASDPNTLLACDAPPAATVDPNTQTTVLTCDRAAGFPEDLYTVTLAGDPNAFAAPVTDLAGNLLDGDADPNTPGGDFTSTFTIDFAPVSTGQAPDPNNPTADPNAAVTVTFDQDMDPNTVTDPNNWSVSGSLGAVAPTTITWDPNTLTATFDPAASLADDTYSVVVDGDPNSPTFVTDATGNALDGDDNGSPGGDLLFSFVIDADMLPVVVTETPVDASTSTNPVTAVVLTFDQLMDPNTLSDPNNLIITGADPNAAPFACDSGPSASADPNTSTSILTCNRAAGFPDGSYTVTLAGDPNAFAAPVTDLAGNLLDGDDNGSGGDDFTSTFIVDFPPLVTAQAPDPNVPSTDPNAVITVTFDQLMDPNTVEATANWTVAGSLGGVAASTITWDPNTLTATFTPAAALADDTYTVTLAGDPNAASSMTDAGGTTLDGDGNGTAGPDFVFAFVMDADPVPQVIAFSPSLDPNAATNDPNASIVLTFDQAMGEPAVEDPNNWSLIVAADPNAAEIPGTITWDPNTSTATFDPAAALADDVYRVRLNAVFDLAGNALDGSCPGGVCDSPAELPTGDPNAVSLEFVADFEIDAVPIAPPPASEPVLEFGLGGVLNWTPPPTPPGGSSPLFNLYRGDMGAFGVSGVYTQNPSQVPEALVECGISGSSYSDGYDPPEGKVAFYLVAEVAGGIEGSLGTDSLGAPRPSEGLCGATSTTTSSPGSGGGTGRGVITLRASEGQ